VASSHVDSRRFIPEISLQELANLAERLLDEHGSSSVRDLGRSVCSLQGVSRMTEDAESRIREALALAAEQGRITLEEDDRVSPRN
jgi:hypothetical protein